MGRKKTIFHILLYIFHIFCSCFGHTCAHTRLSCTTLILFIQSITIIINGTILICLLRFNNISGNKLLTSLNQPGMLICNHMAYFYLADLVNGKIKNQRKDIYLLLQILTTRSIHEKGINDKYDLYSFYYCHIFTNRCHDIIIIPLVVLK